MSWALGGQDPEGGRELAARLARRWIATGRYSEAAQFLTRAVGVPAAADTGIQARVLLGAAWSAFHQGDFRRAAPLATDGIACARQAGEPQLEVWGRNLLAVLAWNAGDADRIVAEIEASQVLSGHADPGLAARAQAMLASAAFLPGDLAEQERHGALAIELARTAAGQEGLAITLTVPATGTIAGAGIQPATVAALDEAANLMAAHPDRFAETIKRRCRRSCSPPWASSKRSKPRSGCAGPQDETVPSRWWNSPPRKLGLASPRPGATPRPLSARSAGQPTAVAASRVSCSFPLPWPPWRAWPPSPVTNPRRPPLSARRARSWAAVARRLPPRRSATPRALWPGTGASSPAPRSLSARPPCSGTLAATGWTPATASSCSVCSPPPATAIPTPHALLAAADAARRPLGYLAPGFTANRGAAANAASQARHILGDDRFTQAWEEGQGLTLDDALAYAARKGGGRKRPATGWASLTPAEREVVRLVSQGLRNDAIARRLFIAPGTVKVHLSHIFAKLGITTRAELAAQTASQDPAAR